MWIQVLNGISSCPRGLPFFGLGGSFRVWVDGRPEGEVADLDGLTPEILPLWVNCFPVGRVLEYPVDRILGIVIIESLVDFDV